MRKQSLLIFLASVGSGFLSYLFQLLAGRILPTEVYGEVYSAFAVIAVASAVGSALSVLVAKQVAENTHLGKTYLSSIIKQSITVQILLSAFVFLLMGRALGYSIKIAAFSAISIFNMNLAVISYGAVQGKKLFLAVVLYNLAQPVSKLVIGLPLLIITKEPVVVFITMSVCSVVSLFLCSKHFAAEQKNDICPSHSVTATWNLFGKSICPVLIYNAILSVHVQLVRTVATTAEIGFFSKSALFADVLLYLPSALVAVMIPTVAGSKTQKEKKKVLNQTLLSTLVAGACAIVGIVVLRRFVVNLLFGEGHELTISLIPLVCLMSFPLMFVVVLANYAVVTEKSLLVAAVCLPTIVTSFVLVRVLSCTIVSCLIMLIILYSIAACILGVVLFFRIICV